MAVAIENTYRVGVHPVHAFFLSAMPPLFVGGLVSDLAYSSTYEIQWSNFATWLIAGAMMFTGIALAWALVDLVRLRARRTRRIVYVIVLGAIFILGLLNSFAHARDAWAVMPQGLILSALVSLLGIAAVWLGLAVGRRGETR